MYNFMLEYCIWDKLGSSRYCFEL